MTSPQHMFVCLHVFCTTGGFALISPQTSNSNYGSDLNQRSGLKSFSKNSNHRCHPEPSGCPTRPVRRQLGGVIFKHAGPLDTFSDTWLKAQGRSAKARHILSFFSLFVTSMIDTTAKARDLSSRMNFVSIFFCKGLQPQLQMPGVAHHKRLWHALL